MHFYGWAGWLLRDVADLRGFLELESIPAAAEQWAAEFDHEDLCPICGTS